jgi:hypothetical protein
MSDAEFDDVCLDDGACSAAWDEVNKEQTHQAAQEKTNRARASAFRKRRHAFCAPERRQALEAQDADVAQKKRVALEKQLQIDREKADEQAQAARERQKTTLPRYPTSDDGGWHKFYIRVAGIICQRVKDAKPGLALLAWTTDTHFFSLRVFVDEPSMSGYFSETWCIETQRVTNIVRFQDMRRMQRDSLNDIFGRILNHFTWAPELRDRPKQPDQLQEEGDMVSCSRATISQRVVQNPFVQCEVNEISFR